VRPFEFKAPTRIIYGPGSLSRLAAVAGELGGRRVMLVSDPGLAAAGIVDQAAKVLHEGGVEFVLFDGFGQNPTSSMAERGMRLACEAHVDCFVGLGGGSSMDCAKAVNFLLTNGGTMADYRGYGKARKPLLPMIAIPTTAGTGSEAQSYALIADDRTHRKMACGDPSAAFRVAILDPRLTVSQPPQVTAASGYDAIGHALESYVTTRRTVFSRFFSLEAWRLLENNFEAVMSKPDDLEARAAMQLGACWAGFAIENSMLGATHALANPLTQNFGTTHGVAIAILLPDVVRWNAETEGGLYAGLAAVNGPADRVDCGALVRRLEELRRASRLPARLRDLGIPEAALPDLARSALKEWTGTFNPRPLDLASAAALYRAAY